VTDKYKENLRLYDLVKKAMSLNQIDIENESTKSMQPAKIQIENLDWTDFDVSFLSNLPKIDYLIGADVFFSGNCIAI
jgi:hypothetical protein